MSWRSVLSLGVFSWAVAAAAAGSYDARILSDSPALYLPLSGISGGLATDLSPHHRNGRFYPQTRGPRLTRLPNGETAVVLDGASEYIEVASTASLSVRPGHALTVEAWIQPGTLEFPHAENGYVHWAGKGETGMEEFTFRMYSRTNSANRPNRISGYVFNPDGGEGSGSYFQDPVRAGEWIAVAMVIDARAETVAIYKNGVLRKTTPFSQFGVSPQPGNAPLRVGTRDLRSFFLGAIAKFAVYDRALPASTLAAHAALMSAPAR